MVAIWKWVKKNHASVYVRWDIHAALPIAKDMGMTSRILQKLVVGSIHAKQTCVLLVLRDSSHAQPIQPPQEQIDANQYDAVPPGAIPVPLNQFQYPNEIVSTNPFQPTNQPFYGHDYQPDYMYAIPPQQGAAPYPEETPNLAQIIRHAAMPTSTSQQMESPFARGRSGRMEEVIREHPPMVDYQRPRERDFRNFAQGYDQDDFWSNDDPTPEEEINSSAPRRYTGPSQKRVTDYSEPALRSTPVGSLRRRSRSRSRPVRDKLGASKDTADQTPRRRRDLPPPSPLPLSTRDRYEQRGFDPRLSPIYERSSPSVRQSEDKNITSDPPTLARARAGMNATSYQNPYAGTSTQELNIPDSMPDDASDVLEDTLDDDALKRKMLVKYAGTTVGDTLPTPQVS